MKYYISRTSSTYHEAIDDLYYETEEEARIVAERESFNYEAIAVIEVNDEDEEEAICICYLGREYWP